MKVSSVRITLIFSIFLLVCGPRPASAQAPLEPAQMPPRTLFYLIWRGFPDPEARKSNSLLALWDDADFAPVRSAIAAGMLNSSGEKSEKPKLTREQVQEFAGLLENSFTLAYLREPARRNLLNGAVVPDAKPAAWNGMFFVYDRSGKETLLSKAMLQLRAESKRKARAA